MKVEEHRLLSEHLAAEYRVRTEARGRPCTSPDRGLGNTVEQVLDATGVGPLAKRVIRGITGKPCGCGRRRDRLNRLVPYPRRPA